MRKLWLLAVCAGLASAFAFLLAGSNTLSGVLFAYFAQLPLFLVALSFGAIASMAASITAVIAVMLKVPDLFTGVTYLAATAIPVVVFTRQALRSRQNQKGEVHWYPAGLLLGCLTAIGVVLLSIVTVWLALQPAGFEGSVTSFVEAIIKDVLPPNAKMGGDRLVSGIIPILPGAITIAWLVMAVINSTLAQKLLVHFGHNLRPWPNISALELPQWISIFAAISAVTWLLPGSIGYYGQNLTLVLLSPFFFVGLTVVHSLCRRMTIGGFVLVLFYFTLVAVGWPVIIVTIVGLIENWFGLRQRLAVTSPRGPSEEI